MKKALIAARHDTTPIRMRSVSVGLLSAACLFGHTATQAGGWTPTRTLQGPFAASSLPSSPVVAMNSNGHALLAWNATGNARFAERVKGAAWQASQAVPGASTGAGPVAAAIGNNEVAAIAFTTAPTRYVPSKLLVTLRAPGGSFGTAVEPVPGTRAGDMKLGIACDGTVTLLWTDAAGIKVSSLPGTGTTARACDGTPGTGAWTPATLVSTPGAGASLAELAVNDAGAALAVWQEGAPGNPSSIAAAYQPASQAWELPQTVSLPTGQSTWNPKPGLDAAGNAAVGYLDGNSMVVARRPAAGPWDPSMPVPGAQSVYYPALAMSAGGDLLASWLSLDVSNIGSVWASIAPAGGTWTRRTRLSARAESADWPSAAFAGDGAVAIVGWTDNNANTAKAAVRSAGAWTRSSLGTGYWSGAVPVAAGGSTAVAGWTMPNLANPNAGKLVARTWQ